MAKQWDHHDLSIDSVYRSMRKLVTLIRNGMSLYVMYISLFKFPSKKCGSIASLLIIPILTLTENLLWKWIFEKA